MMAIICIIATTVTLVTLPWIPAVRAVEHPRADSRHQPDEWDSTTEPELIPTIEDPDAYCGTPDVDVTAAWSPDPDATRFMVGDTVSVACVNVSHTLSGPYTLKCIDPGVWDFEGVIRCKYVECSVPDSHPNGTLELSAYPTLPGTTATFACNHGYTLVGQREISCMTSGQWTDSAPMCQVGCTPVVIDQGRLNSRCLYAGCSGHVACDPGHRLSGNSMVVCDGSGQWAGLDWPKCDVISCPRPSRVVDGTFVTEPLPTTNDEYLYDTHAVYSCFSGYVLSGEPVLVCTEQGVWNTSAPSCTDPNNNTKDDTTVPPDNSTHIVPRGPSLHCPSPEFVPHSAYSVHNRTANYSCDLGYNLHGNQIRHCQTNGTWSGDPPVCLPASAMKPDQWKQIFTTNKEWQGKYLYNDGEVGFKFWYLSSTETTLHALLRDDHNTKIDLEGSASADNVILFQTDRLLMHSKIIQDRSWKVRGELTNHPQLGWKFNGVVHSSHSGFSSLYMRPVVPYDYEPPPIASDTEYASATALALGIAIAVMAIIVAALLAAYCVKHKGGFKGTGHRTLTSFENPVYEYENNPNHDDPEVNVK